jgi:hypothetical protein
MTSGATRKAHTVPPTSVIRYSMHVAHALPRLMVSLCGCRSRKSTPYRTSGSYSVLRYELKRTKHKLCRGNIDLCFVPRSLCQIPA